MRLKHTAAAAVWKLPCEVAVAASADEGAVGCKAAAGALRASPLRQLLWCACAGSLVQNVVERLIELELQEARETHDQGISAHATSCVCMQLLSWDPDSQHTCTRTRTRVMLLKVDGFNKTDVNSILVPVVPQGIAHLCQSTHHPAGTARLWPASEPDTKAAIAAALIRTIRCLGTLV